MRRDLVWSLRQLHQDAQLFFTLAMPTSVKTDPPALRTTTQLPRCNDRDFQQQEQEVRTSRNYTRTIFPAGCAQRGTSARMDNPWCAARRVAPLRCIILVWYGLFLMCIAPIFPHSWCNGDLSLLTCVQLLNVHCSLDIPPLMVQR